MSSSIFVKQLRKESIKQNLDYSIASVGLSELSKYIEKADYVLFAPQIKYALKDISKRYETYNVPMDMITEEDYAFLNFNNILTNIKKKIKVMDI